MDLTHEIVSLAGVELVIRKGTVDRENIDWMVSSLFLVALREAVTSPNDTVLDLGAHIGSFSVIAAKEFGARVIGFEPDDHSIGLARANALINGMQDRVIFHRAAVGRADGTVPLYESTENWGHTIIAGGGPHNSLTGRVTNVPMLSLASVMEHVSGVCAFMKFNIEGAEYGMFDQVSCETLASIRAMAGEMHYDLGGGEVDSCVAKLQQCGFIVDLIPQNEMRAILVAVRTNIQI